MFDRIHVKSFFVLFLGFLDKNNDLLYHSGKEVILIYWEQKHIERCP